MSLHSSASPDGPDATSHEVYHEQLQPDEVSAHAARAVKEIQEATELETVEAIRVRLLGRKGWFKELERLLKNVSADQRPRHGRVVNQAKKTVVAAVSARKAQLAAGVSATSKQSLDVTLPGIRPLSGCRHPIMSTMEETKAILLGLGFRYDDYPEVETEFFNFDALNTPHWHPARDMHDSFYTLEGNVMRTHTSAFQTHAMKDFGPPLRAMTSGRCYRRDEIDASHFPIFHQLDAIAIDREISFADLKWTLYQLARGLFGDDVRLRFRPSYFPFTTPSAEVDVWFNDRWLEILGAGMIRPEVLTAGDIDPSNWQGFAFGLGVDRMTMIRHGIDDIRLLYENEDAFLRQF